MSSVEIRIKRSAGVYVRCAFRLLDICRDGTVDSLEAGEIPRVARRMLAETTEVEDVSADIEYAKQALTIGRKNTPNRPLRDQDKRLENLRAMYRKELAQGQDKTPAVRSARVELGRQLDSNPKLSGTG